MIKKAIIPIAGLGTRFLPLSKAIPKEFLPLADKPSIQYIIKEAKDSGIEEIIFVLRQNNKKILEYLKPCRETERILKEKKKQDILEELEVLKNLCQDLTFTYVSQKNPAGDGHAVLQAAKNIRSEPVACMFADDIFEAREPVVSQLANIFKTCQKPVIGLSFQPDNKISAYGAVEIEKIANKLYKIKKIVEKPKKEEAPSNLAVVGRYVLTPEVFHYLKKAKPNKNGEIILADVFENHMLKEGKLIYGYEFSGQWLEVGDKAKWLKSNLYFSLKHPKYGPELKEYLRQIRPY